MNKELEDFKSEISYQLNEILNKDEIGMFKVKLIRELVDELKPEPEFIEGEIVRTHFNGVDVLCEFNTEFDNSTAPYPTKNGDYYKIEALPMHMTVYDGTNIPSGDELVVIKNGTDRYYCGKVRDFNWDQSVTAFQILKDLNP